MFWDVPFLTEPQRGNDGAWRRVMQVAENEHWHRTISPIWERDFSSSGIHLPDSVREGCMYIFSTFIFTLPSSHPCWSLNPFLFLFFFFLCIYESLYKFFAGTEEFCETMDQSERSYQLLGGYAAGEHLYYLELDRHWNAYIVFSPEKYRGTQVEPPMIKIPVLVASEKHIMDLEYT